MVDNSLTMFFFGINNDTSRSGFEVNIPLNADDIIMDPVSCLRTYIDRTDAFRPVDTKPLLLTLNPPYKAISTNYCVKYIGWSDKFGRTSRQRL